MVLARQGGHAQAGQLIYGRRGPLWISRAVSDDQLEWSTGDSTVVIDFADGELESGEQVPARLHPAGPSQRDERADLDGRRSGGGGALRYSIAVSSVTRIRHG